MITSKTKKQLIAFVILTLIGVTFVGARYARLDKLFYDSTYTVSVKYDQSGGIFTGAEVTYRGVTVGRVGDMELTGDGVDLVLEIEDEQDKIPADTKALVGNRSAVGEQYVELQPNVDDGPFLKDGSEIEQSQTDIPITSSKWLTSTHRLVESVPKKDLRTVVSEFGAAFKDGGDDLTRLIDTSTSFIDTANANFELTRRLIRDSNTVLSTQLDKASAIRSFARDLALVSDTLAASDGDLRRVIANGGATATQLRRFLEENKVDLAKLLNNLVTLGDIQVRHLDGLEMVLILYPYTVAGGFVVNSRSPDGNFDAHFGLILTQNAVCHRGYDPSEQRPPQDGSYKRMDMDARCAEAIAESNARGAQHAPRVAPGPDENVVATYDQKTGTVSFTDREPTTAVTYTGGAHNEFGEESWKWLLLQPLMQ